MSKEKEINVKKKLEGNCLDLSLCDLSTVPVKDILPLTKGTKLDLSCNILSSLPDDFCRLTHLVHLDLSKNHLESLPDNFGALVRLQHVDLLNNRLNLLPVSFSELDSLRWLDVGGNPLDDSLRRIAGDCLDESQCKQCARNVVSYMKSVRDEIGRREQKRLQALKEEEKRKKEGEEAERQRKKAQKLADKERRKREFEEKKAQKESEDDDLGGGESGIKGKVEELPVTTRHASGGCCQLVCQLMTYFVIVTVLSLLGLLVLCSVYPNEQICEVCKRWTHRIVDSVTALAQSKKDGSRT